MTTTTNQTGASTMDASDMTFGVEIETTMPRGAIQIGGYHAGIQADGLPDGWQTMYDGSIRARHDRVGCEFVSPILRGADGIRQIMQAVATIRAMGGRVNRSTGLHIHVGFDGRNRKALDRLITLAANFETAIYASTGTHSRERNYYARGVHELGSVTRMHVATDRNDRYRMLNLTNMRTGRRDTVEFRAFAGTLNTGKIIGYVRMCLGLVERAVKAKRITQWTAKSPTATSPIHRSGEGQTALTRLFYQLGWIHGRQTHTFGHVTCDGAPTIRDTKRTLMALARKYDGN